MSETRASHVHHFASTSSPPLSTRRRRSSLPTIHPDDAKDKVFTAILKVLLKKGNKPSSPKELASDIVKHKYATLGGATPFATVSSRISQHFKRAAQHNPPRAPLLAKHVDQRHSRKIHYSLITPGDTTSSSTTLQPSSSPESSSPSPSSATPLQPSGHPQHRQRQQPRKSKSRQKNKSAENQLRQPSSDNILHISNHHDASSPLGQQKQPSTRTLQPDDLTDDDDDSNDALYPKDDNDVPESRRSSSTTTDLISSKSTTGFESEEDSEADYSDYYEDMMKGDETMAHIEISRRRSSALRRPPNVNSGTTTESPKLVGPKHSLSLLNGGDNEFWTPFSFEQVLTNDDALFLPEQAVIPQQQQPQQHIPLNIVSPESISESELDLYFGGNSSRTSRRSFSVLSDTKEASALQRASWANSSATAQSGDGSLSAGSDNGDGAGDGESPLRIRRKSWPLMVGDGSTDSGDDMARIHFPLTDGDTTMQQTTTTSTDSSDSKHENDATAIPISQTYSENGHRFTITKKRLGNLLCYELDSPDDIPDTKVLRFIASNDGASEHVALRTRHADAAKHDPQQRRRNNQYFYLVEGCVNATQLRKAARPVLGKGTFDAVAEEAQSHRPVVTLTKGSLETRGAWVTLSRARELVDEFEIESSPGLAKLLSDHPMAAPDDHHKDRDPSVPRGMDLSSQSTTTSTDSSTSKLPSLSVPASSDEEFVQFEEDEVAPPTEQEQPSVPASTKPLDMITVQQMMTTLSGFPHITSTPDLVKAITSYMQGAGKATFDGRTTNSPPLPPGMVIDLRSALARFHALDAAFEKGTLTTPTTQSVPTSPVSRTMPPESDINKIYPTIPTNPPMYITTIDTTNVCVATLSIRGGSYDILRRLDTGFVNGTVLLTAGGIDTDRERSMILSFEMERVRVPNKKSRLCGTWIPLRRAQELAATCSIQNRLAGFLSDRLETYFPPSALPSFSSVAAATGGQRKSLARRRASSGSELLANRSALHMAKVGYGGGDTMAGKGSSQQRKSIASTHIQQLLLSHPYKTISSCGTTPVDGKFSLGALKAPHLGDFDRTTDLRRKRSISIINSQRPTDTQRSDPDDSGADDTESDTDVNEVRQRMKRMRDAAIDAMETGQSMEELLSRASGPIVQPKQPIPLKRRRLFDIHEEAIPFRKPPTHFLPHGRRRPPTVSKSTGDLTASMIKKSASWSGALSLPQSKKVTKKRRVQDMDVAQLGRPLVTTSTTDLSDSPATARATKSDDDEDEEIDIGGSDDDDDVR